MSLRIDKVRRGAEIFLTDGSRLAGTFFLSPNSPTRPGGERVSELLSGRTPFLPFHLRDGDVVFVHKEAMSRVLLEQREVDENLPYLQKAGVLVHLLSGETLEGSVYLDLPQDRSRLSDFLNQCLGFFYLEAGDAQYLVNPSCVKMVRPAGGR
jgi:hypothetical protein